MGLGLNHQDSQPSGAEQPSDWPSGAEQPSDWPAAGVTSPGRKQPSRTRGGKPKQGQNKDSPSRHCSRATEDAAAAAASSSSSSRNPTQPPVHPLEHKPNATIHEQQKNPNP
ncbi:unnamed protein product [Boreogadus saida]